MINLAHKPSTRKMICFAIVTMLMFVMVTGAHAASKTVHINGRFAVHSDTISSTNGSRCTGSNSSTSEDRLFMTLEYSDGGGWADAAVKAMPVGGSGSLSSTRSGNLFWRVTLNPDELAYCIGQATVQNR